MSKLRDILDSLLLANEETTTTEEANQPKKLPEASIEPVKPQFIEPTIVREEYP